LLLTNGVTLVAINGLLGLQLATDQRLATLPITTYVIGAALAAVPAALFMKRHGRRAGFMLGAAFGIAGALLSALAVVAASFWLLCLGTVFAGVYNAFGQQYRFAAVDAAPADWTSKAISLTLAGGIVGGVIGPQVGVLTRDLLPPTYLASYARAGRLCRAGDADRQPARHSACRLFANSRLPGARSRRSHASRHSSSPSWLPLAATRP
jgi:MFS family permease